MKYTVVYTGQFKRSLKKCAKRGLNIKTFTDALDILQETGTLPSQYKAHRLADGRQSIYLDIYKKGVRIRIFLNKYLVPETSVTKN